MCKPSLWQMEPLKILFYTFGFNNFRKKSPKYFNKMWLTNVIVIFRRTAVGCLGPQTTVREANVNKTQRLHLNTRFTLLTYFTDSMNNNNCLKETFLKQ